MFGSKLEPNGQITVNIVLYGGTVLYGWTPSFQKDRTCTVLYGVLRYGNVITVKKAEVRRISTSLVVYVLTFVDTWIASSKRTASLLSSPMASFVHSFIYYKF